MADWSNPTVTTAYENWPSAVRERDVDTITLLEGRSPTNLPDKAKKINVSVGRIEKWDSTNSVFNVLKLAHNEALTYAGSSEGYHLSQADYNKVGNTSSEVTGLTSDELLQLQNIDSITISNVQWGYLGELDQTLKQSATPTFTAVDTGQGGVECYPMDQGVRRTDDVTFNLMNAGTVQENGNQIIPSGTKMVFKQGSAPAGWTFQSEDNDRALLNTSTESEGGNTGGTWQLPDVNGHTLTVSEMPSHNHDYTGVTWKNNIFGGSTSGSGGVDNGEVTSSTGGGNAHSHSQVDSWRPMYVRVITCSKE